eukprot:3697933-Prymnesium_polylepis.1
MQRRRAGNPGRRLPPGRRGRWEACPGRGDPSHGRGADDTAPRPAALGACPARSGRRRRASRRAGGRLAEP